MRARLILGLIAGLLFCTLSTLELPEFLRLIDDTSNDFLLTEVESSVPTMAQAIASQPEHECASVIQASKERSDSDDASSRSIKPSRDLLHSLCTLRT